MNAHLEQSYRSGIVLETDWNLDDPKLEKIMSRAEAALILATALNLEVSSDAPNPFLDLKGYPTDVTHAVLALTQAGMINGMTEDRFGPEWPLTRGQVSKIFALVQQHQEKQQERRLILQAEVADIKGDVQAMTDKGSRLLKVGDALPMGTELQTGVHSNVTLKLTDGDTLFVDASSRVTIQELDISLKEEKSKHLQAQELRILEKAILLRGKADEKKIGLNWQTDKPANSYSVLKARNQAVNPKEKPAVRDLRSTQWVDNDIFPGNTYHYQVFGSTGPDEGIGSQEVSFEVVKKASFKLWVGKVVANVKSLFSPSSKFEVQTPTTTAGVRGTTFSVSHYPDGRSNVKVYSGSVALYEAGSPAGQPQVILQSQQQATVEKLGQSPDVMPLQVSEEGNFVKESLATSSSRRPRSRSRLKKSS